MKINFRNNLLSTLLAWSLFAVGVQAFTLPDYCGQVILGLADDWDSSRITLQRFEREADGGWRAVSEKIPARIGQSGLAWGRGLHPPTPGGANKKEGDWKAPAGVFTIGEAYGYAANIEKRGNLPYNQIKPGDLWVEDPSSPHYNQLVVLDRPANSKWERQQQMHLNDAAHSLKLFIAHNAIPDIEPGAGSAIFFHIWRANGEVPSAGCTAMSGAELKKLIAWVNPDLEPLYVLLPLTVYEQVKKEWQLP